MEVYVSKGGQQYGPYTVEQLREYVQQGNFLTGDYACFDGQNWVAIADVPGFGGQKFMEETLEKVKVLRKEIDTKKLKTQIEIDGGINFENAKIAIKAGVDILVSGTTIFKENGGNLKKNIQLLKTG